MERPARRGAHVVYDLYDPLLFEALAFHHGDDQAPPYATSLSRAAMVKQMLALTTGQDSSACDLPASLRPTRAGSVTGSGTRRTSA
jgi:hypothetical protein